jgi:TPR repeat protein
MSFFNKKEINRATSTPDELDSEIAAAVDTAVVISQDGSTFPAMDKKAEKAWIKRLKVYAEQGNVEAQFELAHYYDVYNKGNLLGHYAALAAEGGNIRSLYLLGKYYFIYARSIPDAINALCRSHLHGDLDATELLNRMIEAGVHNAEERIQAQIDAIKRNG